MILYVDTTENNKVLVFLEKNGKIIVKKSVSAKYAKGERLLALIDKFLKEKKLKLKDVKKIKINNSGGSFTPHPECLDRKIGNKRYGMRSKNAKCPERKFVGAGFTSLRIGVVIANALGYALRIPVEGVIKSKKLKVHPVKYGKAVAKQFNGARNKKFNIAEPIYNRAPNITSRNNGQ